MCKLSQDIIVIIPVSWARSQTYKVTYQPTKPRTTKFRSYKYLFHRYACIYHNTVHIFTETHDHMHSLRREGKMAGDCRLRARERAHSLGLQGPVPSEDILHAPWQREDI